MLRKTSVLLLATLFAVSCATSSDDPDAKAKRGATIGAVAGAIAGAIIGNQTGGNARTGAVVGAAIGGALGASVGHDMDKQEQELRQIPGVEVSRTSQNEITVNVTGDILFDADSAALRPQSIETLREIADNFAQHQNETYTIEGHTDSIGTPEQTQAISVDRAVAVRDFLVQQGVSPKRLTTIGRGATMPKATNDTPEGRQMNRRVEIHIHGGS